MSNIREFVIEDEINLMLEVYAGSPDILVNNLLADYFTEQEVLLKTANGSYKTKPKLEFPPECEHEEHNMFMYCPYTPEQRREIGDKLS